MPSPSQDIIQLLMVFVQAFTVPILTNTPPQNDTAEANAHDTTNSIRHKIWLHGCFHMVPSGPGLPTLRQMRVG